MLAIEEFISPEGTTLKLAGSPVTYYTEPFERVELDAVFSVEVTHLYGPNSGYSITGAV